MKTQDPGQQTPPSDVKPKEIPSFSGLVKESQENRARELETPVGGEPKTQDSVEKAPGKLQEPLDFDSEWNKLPETLRKGFVERFNAEYAQAIQSDPVVAPLLPLLDECRKDPNLLATFQAAAKDPELRQYLADPKAREEIKYLTKRELREFLFGEARTTYERYAREAPPAPGEQPKDAGAERIKQLEDKFQADIDMRGRTTHVDSRKREMQALVTEFPGLKDDQKLLQHVVTWAEQRFEQQALKAGISVDDERNPGWVSQALRAGVKPPTYREGYEYYAEVLGRAAPPVAPSTSAATPPQKPQAPRTASEGKNREAGLQFLKKKGGFNNLIAAASRRGRE